VPSVVSLLSAQSSACNALLFSTIPARQPIASTEVRPIAPLVLSFGVRHRHPMRIVATDCLGVEAETGAPHSEDPQVGSFSSSFSCASCIRSKVRSRAFITFCFSSSCCSFQFLMSLIKLWASCRSRSTRASKSLTPLFLVVYCILQGGVQWPCLAVHRRNHCTRFSAGGTALLSQYCSIFSMVARFGPPGTTVQTLSGIRFWT
jgi:hypothetical protein